MLFLPHSSTEYNYKIWTVNMLILEGGKNHSADWENQKKTEIILRYIYTKIVKALKEKSSRVVFHVGSEFWPL